MLHIPYQSDTSSGSLSGGAYTPYSTPSLDQGSSAEISSAPSGIEYTPYSSSSDVSPYPSPFDFSVSGTQVDYTPYAPKPVESVPIPSYSPAPRVSPQVNFTPTYQPPQIPRPAPTYSPPQTAVKPIGDSSLSKPVQIDQTEQKAMMTFVEWIISGKNVKQPFGNNIFGCLTGVNTGTLYYCKSASLPISTKLNLLQAHKAQIANFCSGLNIGDKEYMREMYVKTILTELNNTIFKEKSSELRSSMEELKTILLRI